LGKLAEIHNPGGAAPCRTEVIDEALTPGQILRP